MYFVNTAPNSLGGTVDHREIKEFAVNTICKVFGEANIKIKQILLFGSQARGDDRPDSDWDFLVSIEKKLTFPEKTVISTNIQTILATKLISADIIIKSEAIIEKERNNVGVITYYALKDGIFV